MKFMLDVKNEKKNAFLFPKHDKFWSSSLDNFFKHDPLIFEIIPDPGPIWAARTQPGPEKKWPDPALVFLKLA